MTSVSQPLLSPFFGAQARILLTCLKERLHLKNRGVSHDELASAEGLCGEGEDAAEDAECRQTERLSPNSNIVNEEGLDPPSYSAPDPAGASRGISEPGHVEVFDEVAFQITDALSGDKKRVVSNDASEINVSSEERVADEGDSFPVQGILSGDVSLSEKRDISQARPSLLEDSSHSPKQCEGDKRTISGTEDDAFEDEEGVEERLVKIKKHSDGRKRCLVKTPPSSLESLSSASQLHQYSISVLRTLARQSGLAATSSTSYGREELLEFLKRSLEVRTAAQSSGATL